MCWLHYSGSLKKAWPFSTKEMNAELEFRQKRSSNGDGERMVQAHCKKDSKMIKWRKSSNYTIDQPRLLCRYGDLKSCHLPQFLSWSKGAPHIVTEMACGVCLL